MEKHKLTAPNTWHRSDMSFSSIFLLIEFGAIDRSHIKVPSHPATHPPNSESALDEIGTQNCP